MSASVISVVETREGWNETKGTFSESRKVITLQVPPLWGGGTEHTNTAARPLFTNPWLTSRLETAGDQGRDDHLMDTAQEHRHAHTGTHTIRLYLTHGTERQPQHCQKILDQESDFVLT